MRLIDADVFVEDLGTEALNLAMDGLKGTPRPIQHLCEIIDRINEQPTAFDIDKVVEELKELEGIQFDGENESYQLNWCIETNRAIEIVKQGGVRKERD